MLASVRHTRVCSAVLHLPKRWNLLRLIHTVHLGALASHSRYYRERPVKRGLAWQGKVASPFPLHPNQTRVWHPWTRPEALPLRHRSRAFRAPENQRPGVCPWTLRGAIAPLRPLARTIASRHPLVRAFELRHHDRGSPPRPCGPDQGARPLDHTGSSGARMKMTGAVKACQGPAIKQMPGVPS
jgi:hypothetical protein